MPEPKAMNIAVFLDEVMSINGPADVYVEEPDGRRPEGLARPRDHLISAMDAGRSDRDASSTRKAALSRRPARPAAW